MSNILSLISQKTKRMEPTPSFNITTYLFALEEVIKKNIANISYYTMNLDRKDILYIIRSMALITQEKYLSLSPDGTIIRSLALKPLSNIVDRLGDPTDHNHPASIILDGVISTGLSFSFPQTTRAVREFTQKLPDYSKSLSKHEQVNLIDEVGTREGGFGITPGLLADITGTAVGIVLGLTLASHGHHEGIQVAGDLFFGKITGNILTDVAGTGERIHRRRVKNRQK